ncbi:hypothetical protein ACFW9L_44030 [Streptomyces sp. NPDC059517]|uniref:hypothetical protein n=1 Tax=Streptomyces sp. NPDC059517 TaxID=3346855 RepID=UPI0036B17D00
MPWNPRLPKIIARTLAVCAPDDSFSLLSLAKFAAALGRPTRVLSDGHRSAQEQVPQEFADIVVKWAGRDCRSRAVSPSER